MRYAYPARVSRDGKSLTVNFRDVPEAITQVEPGQDFAAIAADALASGLSFYVDDGRPLPRPSRPRAGERLVALPLLDAAKLALHEAMIEARVSNVALARKLGISEGAIRRLKDVTHRSHIGQVEAALGALGKRLTLATLEAA